MDGPSLVPTRTRASNIATAMACRDLTERDVRVMTAVATSFSAFFAKNRELFTTDEPDPTCESYFDDNDVEVRFTAPYEAHDDFEIVAPARRPIRRFEPKVPRNAPCPSGSGKKYKKCCLPKDEIAAARSCARGGRATRLRDDTFR
jgi:hypothetical protein